MLKNMFIMVALLFAVNVALADPVSENFDYNITSIDNILHIDKGFTAMSTAWSPDGQFLLVTYSTDYPSNIVKHYLLDINSHTSGEINYGIEESNTKGILEAKWAPDGNKLYFEVSRSIGLTDVGQCFIICNPNGMNLKCVGTNYTDLSTTMENIGNIGLQRNLNWNSNSDKIAFEWQKPEKFSTEVYIENENGTNAHKIYSGENPQPEYYDSNKVLVLTDEGTVDLIDENGDLIQKFQPENENEQYRVFSLSPDRKKIMFISGLPGNYDFQTYNTYISNIDGSGLKGNISSYSNTDEGILIKEFWQPNGSLLLVNLNGNLYIIEGEENNKRLLYKGNASEPQWFPDGKKILFVENKNKLYSIDVDGTNLTHIADFGLTSSLFWDFFWSPINKANKFSISPSGDLIAFTSALYPDTGKIIENEPRISKCQNIATPLFVVNSDGSNLTQITQTTKGRHDVLREWSPDGKRLTIGSILFSSDSDWDEGENFLVELNSENSSSAWKSMPVKEIIGNEEPSTVGEIQIDEFNSTNTSQINEHKETGNQSPSFMFFQLFSCIIGIWLLHKNREQ
ncbi:MAG: TolB family protein [Methanosarcina sp.]|jgi:Tol biopolymer transport system component